ncbi:MAG: hypothetical protein KGI50_06855 [Patescibacteria group bacterium]|nr:hypothetical protein [Patescibacteria group bacterium]MDE2439342.1 hypothetical protein [Patescibacteria group bacterium]
MISLEAKVMNINERVHKIKDFKAAWMTPKGLTFDLGTAIEVCKTCNFDPDLTIRPVVVAVSEESDDIFEVVH